MKKKKTNKDTKQLASNLASTLLPFLQEGSDEQRKIENKKLESVIRAYINMTKFDLAAGEVVSEITIFDTLTGSQKVKIEYRKGADIRYKNYDYKKLFNAALEYISKQLNEVLHKADYIAQLIYLLAEIKNREIAIFTMSMLNELDNVKMNLDNCKKTNTYKYNYIINDLDNMICKMREMAIKYAIEIPSYVNEEEKEKEYIKPTLKELQQKLEKGTVNSKDYNFINEMLEEFSKITNVKKDKQMSDNEIFTIAFNQLILQKLIDIKHQMVLKSGAMDGFKVISEREKNKEQIAIGLICDKILHHEMVTKEEQDKVINYWFGIDYMGFNESPEKYIEQADKRYKQAIMLGNTYDMLRSNGDSKAIDFNVMRIKIWQKGLGIISGNIKVDSEDVLFNQIMADLNTIEDCYEKRIENYLNGSKETKEELDYDQLLEVTKKIIDTKINNSWQHGSLNYMYSTLTITNKILELDKHLNFAIDVYKQLPNTFNAKILLGAYEDLYDNQLNLNDTHNLDLIVHVCDTLDKARLVIPDEILDNMSSDNILEQKNQSRKLKQKNKKN